MVVIQFMALIMFFTKTIKVSAYGMKETGSLWTELAGTPLNFVYFVALAVILGLVAVSVWKLLKPSAVSNKVLLIVNIICPLLILGLFGAIFFFFSGFSFIGVKVGYSATGWLMALGLIGGLACSILLFVQEKKALKTA